MKRLALIVTAAALVTAPAWGANDTKTENQSAAAATPAKPHSHMTERTQMPAHAKKPTDQSNQAAGSTQHLHQRDAK